MIRNGKIQIYSLLHDKKGQQNAVRELLKKMNIEVVELEEKPEQAKILRYHHITSDT